MHFVSLLLCLALQHYFAIRPTRCTIMRHYLAGWMPLLLRQSFLSPWFMLAGLVLPIVLVVLLLRLGIWQMTGDIGHFVFDTAVFWCCLSVIPDKPHTDWKTCLMHEFRYGFAPIFWFFVLGSVGVITYRLTLELIEQLEQQSSAFKLLAVGVVWQRLCEWIPLQLMGLSYALAGHFTPGFALWIKGIGEGLVSAEQRLEQWGSAALSSTSHVGGEDVSKVVDVETNVDDKSITRLLDRCLLLWLTAMAIFEIGAIIG